jgi:hypothetical protein
MEQRTRAGIVGGWLDWHVAHPLAEVVGGQIYFGAYGANLTQGNFHAGLAEIGLKRGVYGIFIRRDRRS